MIYGRKNYMLGMKNALIKMEKYSRKGSTILVILFSEISGN